MRSSALIVIFSGGTLPYIVRCFEEGYLGSSVSVTLMVLWTARL
jgi:hypothetical protein